MENASIILVHLVKDGRTVNAADYYWGKCLNALILEYEK